MRNVGPGISFRLRRALQARAAGLRARQRAAYGYSVTITASFGIPAAMRGAPSVPEIFLFAAGAVVAFALVEAVASGGFRHRLSDEPSDVRALGVSFSFSSVALAAALAVGNLTGGLLAWPLGSFFATVVYLFVFALEMGTAEKLQPELKDQEDPEGWDQRGPDEGV